MINTKIRLIIFFAAKEKKNIKRGAKIEPLASLLFTSFGSACPHILPHTLRMYFPLLAK